MELYYACSVLANTFFRKILAVTLSRLVALYASWLAKKVQSGQRSQGTADYYAYHHQCFLNSVGDVAVETLLPWHLMNFSTLRNPMQAVQRLFNWGEDAGLVVVNAFRRMQLPPPGQRKRIFAPPEEKRILRAANRFFRNFAFFMRESLARPQEARELWWEDLHVHPSGPMYFQLDDFKGLNRRKDKTAVRIIPVTPRLERLLRRLLRQAPAQRGPVLLNTEGVPWTSNAVRIEMRMLRSRLRIGRDRRGENVVAYTFRHTTATKAVLVGLRDKILAELMGHASTRTTERYQHVDATQLLGMFQLKFPSAAAGRRQQIARTNQPSLESSNDTSPHS